ncbi:hypothetical protein SAMN05421640_2801 [Ekhidna lutea]|uniref:DUF4270 domain-containing protein n=2 Tax=Ekhidna lutea TaxID=447679 RepID=A0A239KN28_EKHLU|nr:hypothetical protein SAMN05421640_2801 [Ekhidna lutea]
MILKSLITTYTMNLLAKKRLVKNILKPGLIILIPVFFGCETQNDIGIKYDLGSDANVKFIEFTLPASNIYIDSLRTDGENRILVGSQNDPLTGSVAAEGYFGFSYESGPMPRPKASTEVPNPQDTLKMDSLLVFFETESTIPLRGNTFQEFGLYELQDSLENSAIYLASLEQVKGTQIGSFSKSINVATDTLYRLKLDQMYAESFFDYLSEIAGDTNRSIGSTVFKSLAVVPGSSSESIASLSLSSDTTKMFLYTSPVDPDAKDTTYITSFRFTGKHYTYLDRNRSGSSFDGIEEKQNFDLPDGETIIDPITGISTAFSLNQLDDFFNENRSILINNASVTFEIESENNRDTLISVLNFFRKPDEGIFGPAKASNPFGNIVMADEGYFSLQSSPARGSLNSDKSKILMTSTLFYQSLYRQYLEGDSLAFRNPSSNSIVDIDDLVMVSDVDVTLQRTIIKPEGIKLRLYYTEVE